MSSLNPDINIKYQKRGGVDKQLMDELYRQMSQRLSKFISENYRMPHSLVRKCTSDEEKALSKWIRALKRNAKKIQQVQDAPAP